MEKFSQHIYNLTKGKVKDAEVLKPYFLFKKITKGTHLLLPENPVLYAWSVSTGILRAYYYQEVDKQTWKEKKEAKVREVSSWLVPAPGFLTDLPAFLFSKPSAIYIEALEDCELYSLSLENYKNLQYEFPEFANFIFERSLVMADSRVKMLQLRRPKDRLVLMDKMYPGLLNRLSVNIVASYINVDPTTLSKIRAQRD